MTGRPKRGRHAAAMAGARRLAAALALGAALGAAGPAGASSTSVTTNSYVAHSTSSDIDLSCKDMSLEISGSTVKLEGTCNGGSGASRVTLDSSTMPRVACPQSGANAGKLVWSSKGGFLENTAGPHVDTGGTGKTYRLAGTCGIDIHNQANDQAVDTLVLDTKIKNKNGELQWSP